LKTLVIDDEKPTLSMFRLFLSAYGYTVFIAEDGEAGLGIFEREKPEIVFTDLKMPGMDGLEVLKKIRGQVRGSEVIIITGHGTIDKAIEALDFGASDFINKPVEKAALDAALKRARSRIEKGPEQTFSMWTEKTDSRLDIHIKGKLSRLSESVLQNAVEESSGETVFRFDESFAVDREGLRSLISLIARLNEKGGTVSMTGLSYNYARFFQMAGLQGVAGITEERPNE
jgi:DNA-binding response OmpR family regulator